MGAITAASCFADNPAESAKVPAGAPKLATKAVIGRTDLATTSGAERTVVKLVPRDDRDVVLAKLSAPVANVRPAQIAAASAQAGEKLTLTGYGRTKDEWAPLKAHNGTFTAAAAGATDVDVTGDNAAICSGDGGAPLFRTSGDIAQAPRPSRTWSTSACRSSIAPSAARAPGIAVSLVRRARGTAVWAATEATVSRPKWSEPKKR
ncbi:trypsin-like serine protease [Streptomyces sp. NPDC053079]|uniref:trypsin-like serine protease n=1 Tax=Streptomyces sp. NPDC053079 TaxID=3365697 RepID=UPI0037D89203